MRGKQHRKREERLRKSILPETAPLVRQTAGAAWGRADSCIWSVRTKTPLPKKENLKIKTQRRWERVPCFFSFGNPVLPDCMTFFEYFCQETRAGFPDPFKNPYDSIQHYLFQHKPILPSSSPYSRLIFEISAAIALPGLQLHLRDRISTLSGVYTGPGWVSNRGGTAVQQRMLIVHLQWPTPAPGELVTQAITAGPMVRLCGF